MSVTVGEVTWEEPAGSQRAGGAGSAPAVGLAVSPTQALPPVPVSAEGQAAARVGCLFFTLETQKELP